MRMFMRFLALILPTTTVLAAATVAPLTPPPKPQVAVREVRYDGQLSDVEARFGVDLDLEVTGSGEAELPLFNGEVAVLPTKLPANLRLVREGNRFRLIVAREGRYRFRLDLVAKITRQEPWNQVSFTGPEAAIGSVNAQANGAGLDLQLLSGTTEESTTKDGVTRVRGFLGPARNVSLRWQSKAAEVTRKALLTCETTVAVQVTPTVVKYKTDLKLEILQGNVSRLTVVLPAAQTLTKLQGEGVRDWQIKSEGGQQVLTVEFIKPVEKSYALTLLSEQTIESAAPTAQIAPPQPQEVERESGSLAVSAEDVLVETDAATGLRQVNAASGALAAYQFYSRPFTLALRLRRIEPVVNVADRVTVRLEESRLLVTHVLTLNVEKAGIYALELMPQSGFVVADVRGDGIEDWKASGGKLTVNFSSRVLDSRRLEVQLEQAFRPVVSGTGVSPVLPATTLSATATGETPVLPAAAAGGFPAQIIVGPLRATGAAKETAQIEAVGAPGIQLKTATEGLVGLREVPINLLSSRAGDALGAGLAYNAEQAEWKLILMPERMAPRITADVFNLITIGDGLLGGSATIRYAIINQGVQEFRVKVPVLWKNVEFTGPNIRRKELQDGTWVIGLQDKAWGGYTLVVTYDYQFDPHKATLPIGGIHPDSVERETGSVAITSAGNLQLTAQPNGDNIRRVDEVELADSDRSLVTRPVLMAYKYQGPAYGMSVDVTRFDELPVLDAVADRTQMTTVLTEEGQMLTQASFMVKNNDRQFQTFTLPEGADFWACYVGGEPVKPEKNAGKLLVPLPRRANRDEAFAVDIVYVQKIGSLKSITPRTLALAAPVTDMQTTYAEWELYVPKTHRLASFGGNMIVARGTTYGLRDGWLEFCRFYDGVYRGLRWLIVWLVLFSGLVALIVTVVRRGWRAAGFVAVLVVIGLILAAMMLPALNQARGKARRANSLSNLKQIGLGIGMYAENYAGRMPTTFEDLRRELTSEKVFYDVESGEKFAYVGAGRTWQDGGGDNVVAYSPVDKNGRNVLFSDGHVQWMSSAQFVDALGRTVAPQMGRHPMKAEMPRGEATGSLRSVPPAAPPSPSAAVTRGGLGGGGRTRVLGGENTYSSGTAGRPDSGVLGFGSTADAALIVPGVGGVAPMVAGIRPIRIDIPKSGTRFVFTKVLNVGQEPLAVQALAMDDKVFKAVRGGLQALVFIAGLILLWWQWRVVAAVDNRGRAYQARLQQTFLIALGLGLAIGSVVNLLLSTRLLGAAMIGGVPVLALAVVVILVRKFLKRRDAGGGMKDESGGTIPPVVAGIVVLLFAASAAQAATNDVSILSATYTGAVRAVDGADASRVVQFEAVLNVETAEPNQTARLFGPGVAVQEFSGPKSGGWFSSSRGATDARLVREGPNVGVFLPQKGPATLRLKFLVKLGGDAAKRQIRFGVPPALTSRAAITLDEPEAMVEAPTAILLKSTAVGQQTLVETVLGATNRVELTWTPRMKRAAEIATTVFCQNASLVTFGGGAVNVRSVLDYQVTQGELRQMQVKLPVEQRLMRVEGDGIRTWKLDGQILSVELSKGVSPSYRLTVETEKPVNLGDGGGSITNATKIPRPARNDNLALLKVEVPHAVDVKRETGLVALKASEEFGLTVEGQGELQKVDVAEFTQTMQAQAVSSAYRFLKPDFVLSVKVEPVQPQIEAVVRNAVRVGTDQIGLQATVEYTIKRTGVFTLRLGLPVGYRVERVTGNNVSQWVEKEAKSEDVRPDSGVGAPTLLRVLEVKLKERTMGAYRLTMDLAQTLRELSQSVEVVGVQPLDTQKLTGFVSVSSEEGVQIKAGSFDGLTEVPAAMAGRGGDAAPTTTTSGLAFKLIPLGAGLVPGEATTMQPGWKLTVTTEKIESWVRAEVMNTISLTETLVSGRSLVRYEIQNAPTKEFRVRVPAAFQNVEVTGPNIRRKDKDEQTGEWRIELQSKVRGSYTLTVTWDMPWNVRDGTLELMGLEAVGVERETGSLAIVAPGRLKLDTTTVTPDLLKTDARDLPDWAGRTSELPVLAYRYLRPGYKLTLAAQRFEEAEVLQALVDNVQLTTVVAEDGQMMTEMTLAVRNNARQYLEVVLPEGAQVWSAFVAGQPVRPSKRDGKLLLPMERSSGDAPVPVELTYVGAGRFPRGRGAVGMASPALDVPLKNARWELYLPPDFRYGDFEGSMKHEAAVVDDAQSRKVALFSLSEYAQVESEKKAERDADVLSSLSNARSQLAEGKVGGAVQFFNRAKQKVAIDDLRGNEDLKQLEKDVRQSQAQNLNQAQQRYMFENNAQLVNAPAGGPQPSPQQSATQMLYDEQAAEQQAAKLQQAQEVAVARTLPLRVNLPKRGIHYSFSQVLQTEIGKPMTVRFRAVNEGAVSWPTRIGLGLAGFAVLWLAVAGVLTQRRS